MIRRCSLPLIALCVTLMPQCAVQAQDLKGLSVKPAQAPAAPACDPKPKDPSIWDKSLLFGFNYTEGNTKTTNINIGGVAARDYENNAWRFQADYNFGSAANNPNDPREQNNNNFRSLADYRRVLDNTWFAGAGASFAHDEIADLKYRVVLSPSLGAYILRDDDVKLSLEAGPSYVWEKLGDEDDSFAAARIANRLEWKFSDTSKLFEFTEYLVSFEDADQYLINAEVGLETVLNSFMSLVVSVRDYYINQPAEGRVQNDVITITALKVML